MHVLITCIPVTSQRYKALLGSNVCFLLISSTVKLSMTLGNLEYLFKVVWDQTQN